MGRKRTHHPSAAPREVARSGDVTGRAGGLTVPAAIEQALLRRPSRQVRAFQHTLPRAGEIRRVRRGTTARLAYVLKDCDPRGPGVQITLVHPYVEYATDADHLVDGAVSALGYDLLVQWCLDGVVFPDQLDPVPLACLDPQMVSGIPAGSPLCSPLDARWAFKDAERQTLQHLCAPCRAAAWV